MTAILEVENLATGYRDLRAVWDVSLSARAGEVNVILGRNGAGKTTTLRAIAGLLPLQGGQLRLDGADIGRWPAHRRAAEGISFVQEGRQIFRRRTVEENLLIGGYRLGLRRRGLRGAVDRAIEPFPILQEFRARRAGSLSGGQQQMLAIAQALVADPKVLLIDEPSIGLAPVVVADIMDAVQELRAHGCAIVLVEQAIDHALRVADRVLVMHLGRVTYDGSADVGSAAAIRSAYLGSGFVAGSSDEASAPTPSPQERTS